MAFSSMTPLVALPSTDKATATLAVGIDPTSTQPLCLPHMMGLVAEHGDRTVATHLVVDGISGANVDLTKFVQFLVAAIADSRLRVTDLTVTNCSSVTFAQVHELITGLREDLRSVNLDRLPSISDLDANLLEALCGPVYQGRVWMFQVTGQRNQPEVIALDWAAIQEMVAGSDVPLFNPPPSKLTRSDKAMAVRQPDDDDDDVEMTYDSDSDSSGRATSANQEDDIILVSSGSESEYDSDESVELVVTPVEDSKK